MSADKVVVSGYLVRCPLGGYAWQVLHYLVGLRQLGFEPYFYEDNGGFASCFDPRTGNWTDDPGVGLAFAGEFLGRNGFGRQWTFWDIAGARTYGLTAAEREALLEDARVVINLAGVNHLPVRRRQRRVFVDLDPVFTQIRATTDRGWRETLAEHDVHFTFGENIGRPGCRAPAAGFSWHPTRQPVAVELWQPVEAEDSPAFTTIGRWDDPHRDLHFEGETYSWRKRIEWMKFLDLPARTGERFAVAMDVHKNPEDLETLARHRWEVRDPILISADPWTYRDFIRASKGEFTVAKDLNIRFASGWFSDRSACYLAAGRPVVTQDTGFDRVLPTGGGLFAFRDIDQAAASIRSIASDYAAQSRRAREIARDCFDAAAVVGGLLEKL